QRSPPGGSGDSFGSFETKFSALAPIYALCYGGNMVEAPWRGWSAAPARLLAHWEKLAAAIVLIFLVVAIKFWPQPTLSELGRQAQSALADGNYTLAYSAYRQA